MTELEMKVGILETQADKVSRNVLCLCRKIEDLCDNLDRRKAGRFVDLVPGTIEIMQHKHEAIMTMKKKIKEVVPESNIFERTIRYLVGFCRSDQLSHLKNLQF